MAALAAWRFPREPWFAHFPREGAWLSPSGQPMTIGEWESPETGGLSYCSLDEQRPYAIRIARSTGTAIMTG